MNAKLSAIANVSADRLKKAIDTAHDDILAAWDQVNAQAQEEEKDPVLTLSFSIKLDLGGNSLTTVLAYGVRRKVEDSGEIPDPNQEILRLDE